MGSIMYHIREGLSTRLRVTAALLSLGSLLSFGLGQALGHLPASSDTATHVTSDQRQPVSAGGSLTTTKLPVSRSRPTSTRRVTTEGDGGHAGHPSHADKHGKPHEVSGPPKAGTQGGTQQGTGTSKTGDASTG